MIFCTLYPYSNPQGKNREDVNQMNTRARCRATRTEPFFALGLCQIILTRTLHTDALSFC